MEGIYMFGHSIITMSFISITIIQNNGTDRQKYFYMQFLCHILYQTESTFLNELHKMSYKMN